mmetsp:Transcript_56106/g.88951  ORF Transcript_56106/g.88951 Transcript_56106/m.88951 type:complete len:553 (+) Transcript_56106:39-1697(+)
MAGNQQEGFVHLLACAKEGGHEPQVFRMRHDQQLRRFSKAYLAFRQMGADAEVQVTMSTKGHARLDPAANALTYGLHDGDLVFFHIQSGTQAEVSQVVSPVNRTEGLAPGSGPSPLRSSEVTPPSRRGNARATRQITGRSLEASLDKSAEKAPRKRKLDPRSDLKLARQVVAKGKLAKAAAAAKKATKSFKHGVGKIRVKSPVAGAAAPSNSITKQRRHVNSALKKRTITQFFRRSSMRKMRAQEETDGPCTKRGHMKKKEISTGPAKGWRVTAWLRDLKWNSVTSQYLKAVRWHIQSPDGQQVYTKFSDLKEEVNAGVYTHIHEAIRPQLYRQMDQRRKQLLSLSEKRSEAELKGAPPLMPPPSRSHKRDSMAMPPPPRPQKHSRSCIEDSSKQKSIPTIAPLADLQVTQPMAPVPVAAKSKIGGDWSCGCDAHLRRHERCIKSDHPELVHLRDYMLIGRSDTCDLKLDSKRTPQMLSRCHAVLSRENGLFTLTDQGSLNGVMVNGERVDGKQPLTDQDVITFGVATPHPEMDYVFEKRPLSDDVMSTIPM